MSFIKRNGKSLAVLSFVVLLASIMIGSSLINPSKTAATVTMEQRFAAGLGTLDSVQANVPAVEGAVGSLVSFINARSGVTLPTSAVEQLTELEEGVVGSQQDGLTATQIKSIFTQIHFEVVEGLSDTDIENIGNLLRSVPDHTGERRANKVDLRLTGESINPADWQQYAEEYRDNEGKGGLFRAVTGSVIADQLQERLDAYNAWDNGGEWSASAYTPYQVFLLYYSLVSDDYLIDSSTAISNQMQSVANILHEAGNPLLDPTGRYPYGSNGFLYRSAVNYYFTEAALLSLLDKIEEAL